MPRYETPPTTQPAHRSPQTGQTPRHRADENPPDAPTARTRYRVTRRPPPNNQQSLHRNADSSAVPPPPHPAHAPTAQAAPPIAPQPRAVHAAPEPRSHPQAYEPHRHGAAHSRRPHTERNVWRARQATVTWGFATLPLLPSADAPVRAARYASPSVRPYTGMPTTIAPTPQRPQHFGITTSRSRPRKAAASRRHGQQARQRASTASDLRCENFLYCYQGACPSLVGVNERTIRWYG
ncbi:hypothetical protein LAUMK41_03265 [Mycobacterium attenuatum]|nr:hypothetical protein LAUMK41_03265 [Mycobacterium attenuatum]